MDATECKKKGGMYKNGKCSIPKKTSSGIDNRLLIVVAIALFIIFLFYTGNDLFGAILLGGSFLILILLIPILIAIWIYKDAEKRGKNGALWLIIVILTSWFGVIIWFVVRPKSYSRQVVSK